MAVAVAQFFVECDLTKCFYVLVMHAHYEYSAKSKLSQHTTEARERERIQIRDIACSMYYNINIRIESVI